MARKRAAKKPQRRFIVLTSSCGDLSQAVTDYSGVEVFNSEEAAKKGAHLVIATNKAETGDDVDAVYIVEIVAEGAPTGVNWN